MSDNTIRTNAARCSMWDLLDGSGNEEISGVRDKADISGAPAKSVAAEAPAPVDHSESLKTLLEIGSLDLPLDSGFDLPQFGSFVGLAEDRKLGVAESFSTDTQKGVNSAVNKCLKKQGVNFKADSVSAVESTTPLSINSTAEQVKKAKAAVAAKLAPDIAFDNSALKKPKDADETKVLDAEIDKHFGDDLDSVTKKQKSKLIGIVNYYNRAAELSYNQQRAAKKHPEAKSRLANLWGYLKRPVRAVVDAISPNYARKRNHYESHLAYEQTAKAAAKNRLEADVQSISDSYEVLADYVNWKFGKDFAFDVDNVDEVDAFMNDCLHTPASPHYQAIMDETKARVDDRVTKYNAEIANINAEVGSIQYRETTKDILASSSVLRMKKGLNDVFTDIKLDFADVVARFRGNKPVKAKELPWVKRETPTVLGNTVSFQPNQKAFVKPAKTVTEAETQTMENKIARDSKNSKRAGYVLSTAAVVAGLVGGGYLVKKAVDGSTNPKATAGMTDVTKSVLGGKFVRNFAATNGGVVVKPAASVEAKVSDANRVNETVVNETVINSKISDDSKKSEKAAEAAPRAKTVVDKTTKPAASGSKAVGGVPVKSPRAHFSADKAGSKVAVNPKTESVESKQTAQKTDDYQTISKYTKMGQISIGEERLGQYAEAMKEIAQPVVLANGERVAYNPDLLAFNKILGKIGRACLSLKTNSDVAALHAMYATADRMAGELQIARDKLIGPSYVAETERYVGVAKNRLPIVKKLLAGRSAKFSIAAPVKRTNSPTEVSRVYPVDLVEIEVGLAALTAECHSKAFPSQKRAELMVEYGQYYESTLKFAEWYLTHDASRVRF